MFIKVFSAVLIIFLFMALSCEEDSPTEPSTKGSITGFVTNMIDEVGLSKVNIFTDPATSSVTTIEDGSYQIKNVEEGTYKVTAAKDGYDTLSINVTVVGEKETIADFITQPKVLDNSSKYGYIKGTLYDKSTHSLINGVNIKTDPITSSVTTISNGSFFIGNLSSGKYEIFATKDGYDSTSININVSLGDTTIADIFIEVSDTTEVPSTGIVSGKIIDAFTTEAIVNAIVTTVPSTSVVNTNSEGVYSFEKLQPGSYKINVDKIGYQSAESEVLVVAGEATVANFSLLVSHGSILGSVTDSDTGSKISDVLVSTVPGTSSILTDSLGLYSIENLEPKSYTINAEKSGYIKGSISITVSAGNVTHVDIVLSKTP